MSIVWGNWTQNFIFQNNHVDTSAVVRLMQNMYFMFEKCISPLQTLEYNKLGCIMANIVLLNGAFFTQSRRS